MGLKTLKIKEGQHWFKPHIVRKFNPEYVYHLKAAPMVHSAYINKACGITKSFNPHADSIRIGFRRDKDLIIHWYWCVYENKVRTITEIEEVEGIENIAVVFKGGYVRVYDLADETKSRALTIQFEPKWMTNFYWGRTPSFPNPADSFWIETNVNYENVVKSYYNAAFSLSPFLASFLPALAMFLIAVGIAQFSVLLAVSFVILALTTLLGYIAINTINYEKWYLSLKSFARRIRLKLQKLLERKSTTSK